MEHLEGKQRDAIKKMSTVRLTGLLLRAGVKVEDLETLYRGQLMDAWAELVAAGKDVSPTDDPVTATAASSADFERERLQFELEKFKAEMLAREAEQQRETARLAWERSRADEEREERRIAREAEADRAAQQIRLIDYSAMPSPKNAAELRTLPLVLKHTATRLKTPFLKCLIIRSISLCFLTRLNVCLLKWKCHHLYGLH
jgi:hypothetical protein